MIKETNDNETNKNDLKETNDNETNENDLKETNDNENDLKETNENDLKDLKTKTQKNTLKENQTFKDLVICPYCGKEMSRHSYLYSHLKFCKPYKELTKNEKKQLSHLLKKIQNNEKHETQED